MHIRKAVENDLPEIAEIFETARNYMRASGNPNQWGTNRPDPQLIINDIKMQRFYVIVADNEESDLENGTLLGAFAFIIGEDPTYTVIYNGSWLNDMPYGTIHRLAGAGKCKGLFEYIVKWTEKQNINVRADTHEQNLTMQHLLEKNGFTKCGIIYLLNGDPRIAYHKPL